MRSFSLWERVQMQVARPFLWSLEGGRLRMCLWGILLWELVFLVPYSFMGLWTGLIYAVLFAVACWKHDAKRTAVWIAVQDEMLWADGNRDLLDQLAAGGTGGVRTLLHSRSTPISELVIGHWSLVIPWVLGTWGIGHFLPSTLQWPVGLVRAKAFSGPATGDNTSW